MNQINTATQIAQIAKLNRTNSYQYLNDTLYPLELALFKYGPVAVCCTLDLDGGEQSLGGERLQPWNSGAGDFRIPFMGIFIKEETASLLESSLGVVFPLSLV